MKGPRVTETVGDHRYTIRALGESSAKYGPCEVCGERVSEVHSQSEEVRCEDAEGVFWTYVPGLFGHEGCLRAQRAA